MVSARKLTGKFVGTKVSLPISRRKRGPANPERRLQGPFRRSGRVQAQKRRPEQREPGYNAARSPVTPPRRGSLWDVVHEGIPHLGHAETPALTAFHCGRKRLVREPLRFRPVPKGIGPVQRLHCLTDGRGPRLMRLPSLQRDPLDKPGPRVEIHRFPRPVGIQVDPGGRPGQPARVRDDLPTQSVLPSGEEQMFR